MYEKTREAIARLTEQACRRLDGCKRDVRRRYFPTEAAKAKELAEEVEVAGVPNVNLSDLTAALDYATLWALVEALRRSEGASITIFADNADFDGAGAAVEVSADWTNWQTVRFEGDTVGLALAAAVANEGGKVVDRDGFVIAAAAEEPCVFCSGEGWVRDENWEPNYPDVPQERTRGDGLIRCGVCLGGVDD